MIFYVALILIFFAVGVLSVRLLYRNITIMVFLSRLLREEAAWLEAHPTFPPEFKRHEALFPQYNRMLYRFWEPLEDYNDKPLYEYHRPTDARTE